MATAVKVTLTLPAPILDVVDQYVTAHPGTTRSGVCAAALQDWLKAEQDAQIERYYTDLSVEERQEDEDWNQVAARSAADLWP